MKTYTLKGTYTERKWFVVDAEGQTLGRMSSRIATILQGKHKPVFSPNRDIGDYVIVVNAEKVRLTGKKEEQKVYYSHSGYLGHLKTTLLKNVRARNPEFIVSNAVRKMLPKNTLGRRMFKKLKVYAGPDHPHTAQLPEELTLEN